MRGLVWVCSLLTLGCATESSSVVVDTPVSPAPAPAPKCEPAECLRARAEAELAAGILDRASALLERAYAIEPSDPAFERWVGALLESGQRRRATAALAQARKEAVHGALVDELDAQLQASDQQVADVSELVDRGELAWSRGELEAARRFWSQARIALDEREAQLSLAASYRFSAEAMRWVDRRLELTDFVEVGSPKRELAFVRTLEFDASDTPHERPSRVILRDALAEAEAEAEPAPAPSQSAHRLEIQPRRVELFGADGRRMATVEVTGSEWTVADICDGESMWEEKIEIPFEVSAAIVDEELRYLVVATTEGKIVVRDLEYQHGWIREIEEQPYRLKLGRWEPRDAAIALHIQGDELLALTSHAELWRWQLDNGALLGRRDSRCFKASWAVFGPAGEFAVSGWWRGGLCIWEARDGELAPTDVDVEPVAVELDPDARPTVLDTEGRVFVWDGGALRGPIKPGVGPVDRPLAGPTDPHPSVRRTPRLTSDGRGLQWPDPRSPTSWLIWDLVDGGPPVRFDGAQQVMSADRRRIALDLGDAVEVWRDGSLERRFELGTVLGVRLLGADGRLLVIDEARDPEHFFVHDLERGQQWRIERAPRQTLDYQASDDGTRVARLEQGGRIAVWDLDGDTPVLRTTIDDAGRFALAASGRTLVWYRAIPTGGLIMSLDLEASDAEIRKLGLDGEPAALAVAPNGDEVVVADDDGLLRWHPGTHERRRHAWLSGLVFVDRLDYAADASHLIASQPGRVDVVSERMEIEATIEQFGEHWLVTTPSGAVDGSPGVQRELLAIVEGSADGPAYPGSLAWDRFEVPGLLALLLAGQDVEPLD